MRMRQLAALGFSEVALIVNQYVANTEARFTYTDVRVIRKAQMASVENMRTLAGSL